MELEGLGLVGIVVREGKRGHCTERTGGAVARSVDPSSSRETSSGGALF